MPNLKTYNTKFFKKWNNEMSYVLGFFAADGCMIKSKRGTHFIEFTSTDKSQIFLVKKLLNSSHKISVRVKDRESNPWYRLQIGSQVFYKELERLGFSSAKSNVMLFPKILPKFLPHFIRGYFDGDGHVSITNYVKTGRKNKYKVITTGFTSGSKEFLVTLSDLLQKYAKISGGSLFINKGFRLSYSINDSRALYKYMYSGDTDLFLKRKKLKFQSFFKF